MKKIREIPILALGDRCKQYEMAEAGRKAMPGLPLLARLDGRAFHTFTRGLRRPYDERLTRCLVETARFLVHDLVADVGYTQSDEITLAWYEAPGSPSAYPFDGRYQKLTSVLAGLASAKFYQQLLLLLPERVNRTPCFDCRVWQVPTLNDAVDVFIWREDDATKNSVSMAAATLYDDRTLHGKDLATKQELLLHKGVNWNDYPTFFKRGTFLARRTMQREINEEERLRIPEPHRPAPATLVTRSQVVELDLPPIRCVANPTDVLFGGAEPAPNSIEYSAPPRLQHSNPGILELGQEPYCFPNLDTVEQARLQLKGPDPIAPGFLPLVDRSTPSENVKTGHWKLVLDAEIEDITPEKMETIVSTVKEQSKDGLLMLKKIEIGSVVIILDGSMEGFSIIENLYKTGRLTELIGIRIKEVRWDGDTANNGVHSHGKSDEKTSRLFYSYSDKDERFRIQLEMHLASLRREGLLEDWHHRRVDPGEEVDVELEYHLKLANIILLLVSPDFIASDYCFKKEMTQALRQHVEGTSRVVPILLRPTEYRFTPFSCLQFLPKKGKPIAEWRNRDRAWLEVIDGIRHVMGLQRP